MPFQPQLQRVQVVLTNFARPGNTNRIAQAFRSEPDVRLLLANNPQSADCELEAKSLDLFDDVITMRENHGPPCRFLPALSSCCPLTLFWDDDALPNKGIIWKLLREYDRDPSGAVLGMIGRNHKMRRDGKHRYIARNIPPGKEVDMTCRFHLVRTSRIIHAIDLRQRIASTDHPHKWEILWEDDMLLCHGITRATNEPCRLLDFGGRVWRELPAQASYSARSEHKTIRSRFIRVSAQLGWRSKR